MELGSRLIQKDVDLRMEKVPVQNMFVDPYVVLRMEVQGLRRECGSD